MANILSLDPQVQIRIIDVAWDLTKQGTGDLQTKLNRFDRVFKAILKTCLPEETGAPKTKTF